MSWLKIMAKRGTRKLKMTVSHRDAFFRNSITSLIFNEKIVTTLPKAKEISRLTEKIITKAKAQNLSARRYVYSFINDKDVRKKVFEVIVPRYKDINGGYTRIFKLKNRKGDNAPLSLVKLT